jgi:peptide/nickel transport system substrate-binding protein
VDSNYWSQIATRRLTRRRALAAGAGRATAAAFLAACGGDDADESSPQDRSGLLTQPTDTSSSAKRGGTHRTVWTTHVSWDQSFNTFGLHFTAGYVYSRLMKYKVGTVDKLPDGTLEPDFVESFELNDDGLTATFKTRGNLKFDDRSPTNGRVGDTGDIKFSWDRWVAQNPRAPELSNTKSADAPIIGVTTPDSRTAVMKLAFPFAPLFPMLAFSFHPLIYPRETEGGFDPRSVARGSGAWLVEEDRWPTSISLKRNPNWYENERPYYDNWELINLVDYAQGLAQLKTGGVETFGVRQEDIFGIKNENPSLVMTQRAQFTRNTGGWTYFGLRPGSPFRDDRVRKALSMLIDRDSWLDTFSGRAEWERIGVPVETAWTSFVGPGWSFFLDPREKEIGEGGRNFLYNPAEAKKLLAASGVKTPIETKYWSVATAETPQRTALLGLMQASGDFKFDVNLLATTQQLDDQVAVTQGNFDGMGMKNYAEPPDYDFTHYLVFHPKSTDFFMGALGEDAKMTDFVARQRRELDPKKRADIFKDYQRYAAQTMYYIPQPPGDWKSFSLAQPWVGNNAYFQPWVAGPFAAGQEVNTYLWDDASKRR